MFSLPTTIGPYRILRQLGEGGMGAVFQAVHQAIERYVAIKVLRPEYARNPEFIARFFNEAVAVNRVDHPGLVQVSDYSQLPDGTAYIVMEFLRGESLGSRIKRLGGRLSVTEVVRLGGLLADSLAAAHERGIVHRDLKPENVMIVADPNVPGGERTKLLDFGIAKFDEGTDLVRTRTDALMGTPVYMSPEQCRGASQVDDRSDVYSFGVMLFVMLAGKPPFSGEGPGELIGKHLFVQPPRMASICPSVPAPLAALVDRLLLKDKQQRPSMRQVVVELEALARTKNLLPWGERPCPMDEEHTRAIHAPGALEHLTTLGISVGQAPVRRSRKLLVWGIGGILILTLFSVLSSRLSNPAAGRIPSEAMRVPSPRPPSIAARTSAAAASTSKPMGMQSMASQEKLKPPPIALPLTPSKVSQPRRPSVPSIRLKRTSSPKTINVHLDIEE